MSREILLPAANAIHAETMEYMENFVERDNTAIITPIHLDALEDSLHKQIKNQFPEKVSRNFVRQEIVAMILKHYGVEMFGVKPIAKTQNEISEKTIKKYAKKK
ncbi:hypothetical protein Lw1_gp260 [Escherichia phage Lw1]|uniref:Uncharacterized protein n=1 Tax=Escherichia phage Lw1 TaxID=1307804 RepID=M9UY31_9CAUD|nr:hypothetical protein Lw1_gp260 [Escherichia phage Lw1]AGJ71665.1 hypothetical protein Lw1_gp260 [Escherichia phage Lw1]